METKRFNLLIFLFFTAGFLHASFSFAEKPTGDKPLEIFLTFRIVEESSRVELSAEKIKLTEGQLLNQTLKIGQALKNYTLLVGMRQVHIDDKKGSIWIEARLKDNLGQQVAYFVATVPNEKFSLGAGFYLTDKKSPLVLMLDNM